MPHVFNATIITRLKYALHTCVFVTHLLFQSDVNLLIEAEICLTMFLSFTYMLFLIQAEICLKMILNMQ